MSKSIHVQTIRCQKGWMEYKVQGIFRPTTSHLHEVFPAFKLINQDVNDNDKKIEDNWI